MSDFLAIFDVTLLNSIFRFVTPILLAALGGLICERVGIFNIALEGLMLTGAFAGVVGSFYAGDALVGVIAAMLAGGVLAAIFAFLAITLRGDVIVLGIAINLLASGLTVFLLRSLFGVKGAFTDPRVEGLAIIHIPGLERIPVLGPLLSGHSWIVYLSLLLVIALHLLLFRHVLG
ncbi:MAG: ABC transporter permease, partial [Chloroflexota bacterium]|nr:ABC transporter permease [Chloroflexota bacterium]